MTDAEMAEYGRMWRAGVPIAEMATRLGYSAVYLRQVAQADRDRFPYRHRPCGSDERARWVADVAAGRMTRTEAARAAGVAYETMARWVREARDDGRDDRKGRTNEHH